MDAVTEYLESLPHGLSSFPNAKAKASALVGFFEEDVIRARLPAVVVRSTLGMPASSWVPEVHVTAAHIVMRTACYDSDAAYEEYARGHNYRLISSPLYRHAFRLFRPARLAHLVHSTWGLFHRGSTIRIVERAKNSMSFTLQHPPKLWPNFVRRSMLSSGAEALRLAGTEAHEIILEETETLVRGRLEW